MLRSSFVISSFCVFLLCGCQPGAESEQPALPKPPEDISEEGFEPITRDDLSTFPEEAATDWKAESGMLVCGGEVKGYAFTKQSHRNFTLRGEFLFLAEDAGSEKPPNTGFLLFIQQPHRVWPSCLEAQGRFDEMMQIKSNDRDITVTATEAVDARKSARKPIGEWNTFEIVAKEGAVTTKLNGEIIAESEPTELLEGAIGLQSEGFVVYFHNLRIRNDDE